MKHLYKQLLFVAAFILTGIVTQAQVVVVATAGNTGPTVYPNVGAAFAAINSGVHQGVIGVGIGGNTTETGPCVLNSSGSSSGAVYTSVTVSPTVDNVTISGATTTGRGLIELKGADNVTIDGDNPNSPGINRNLTITNTAASTTTFTSVIRLCVTVTTVASADNNTVKNCIINGSATARNAVGITSTTGSENTTYGIYAGGNGGSTDADAPAALTSLTTNAAVAGTTMNAFLVNNNSISSCARAVVFNGAASSISTGVTVTNNTIGASGTLTGLAPFNAPSTTVYSKGIFFTGTNSLTVTGNTIQNVLSYLTGQMCGIELNGNIGSGAISISGNTINGLANNGTGASAPKGILITNVGGAYTIGGNTINNLQWLGGSGTATQVLAGIEINATGGAGTIEKNIITRIYNLNTATYGAIGISISAGNNHTIQNNFISDINHDMSGGFAFDTQYGVYGIRVNGGTGHKIYYNSVNLFGAQFGTPNTAIITAALAIATLTCTGLDVRNNVLTNTITGSSGSSADVCLYLPSGGTSSMNLTLNYNMYYSASATAFQGIGQAGTTFGTNFYTAANFNPASTAPATNMRAYTSTLSVANSNDNASAASTAAAPFTSTTDLHINIAAPNATDLDAKAAVLATITTDIDGAARSATTPDIGADEFVLTGCLGAIGGTASPASTTLCAGATATMSTTGSSIGSGIVYQWKVGNVSGGPYVNVTGGSGATTTSYTTAALSAGTYYYVLQVTCTNGPVTSLSNEISVVVNANPVVTVTPTSATFCIGGPAISLNANGATTYAWGPAAGLSAITGSNVNASPSASTTYTVVGIAASGCTASATTAITSAQGASGVTASATSAAICNGASVDLSSTASSALTVVSENFNSGAPGWTIANAPTTPAACYWHYPNAPFSEASGSLTFTNFSTTNGGGFAETNSDWGGSGSTTNTTLTSPAFSTMGMTAASLTFEHCYRKWASGDVTVAVEVSTDGGATWAVLKNYIPLGDQGVTTDNAQVTTPDNISLAAYLNQPNIKIRFNYVSAWGYFWLIDNVQVAGTMTNTFAWTSSPVGFTSATQNPTGVMPTASTTYSVTVSNGTGCTSSATTSVTVNPNPTVGASSTASAVCNGSPVTLTGSGATTYSWTGGVTDGVPFTPTTTDTYTVTGTDGNGCTGTSMVSVTVNSNPTVIANTTASAVCSGAPVTLTGSGAASYSWTGGVTDGVAFTPTISDTYTVTGTDGNGCTGTDMLTVTVNPLPAVVGNSTASAVCNGNSVTLTGSGATSYSWTGGVTDGVAFTPTVTDTYTVTGTDGNGCSATDMVTVTVNALPTVIANSTATAVCSGSPVTLTGSGATTYTWTGGVTDGVAFNPTITDTYTVTGTDGNGCTGTDMISVTVNSLPVVTLTLPLDTACNNMGNLSLSGESPLGGAWSGTGVSGNSFDPSVPVAGAYSMIIYTYTDSNSCAASATDSMYVDNCNGTNGNVAAGAVNIYPNPNNGTFTIEAGAMNSTGVNVEIRNSLGQLLQKFAMTGDHASVDLSMYEDGVYFVQITDGNAVSTHRVVKQQ